MPVFHVRKESNIDDPLLIAASKMEGKLKKAFLDAVNSIQDKVQLDALRDAVEKGSVNDALAVLALDKKFTQALQGSGLESNITSVREALQQTFAAGAQVAVEELPKFVSTELSFNLMNPEAAKFVDRYEFKLIQQISEDARASIQQVIHRAVSEGVAPVKAAREIRESIGLTATQEKAVASYRNALESGTTTDLRDALSRSLRDGRYDRTLLREIEQQKGLTQSQIDKLVSRYRERYIDYRAKAIARTETIRAANSGQREVWRQAREQGLISHDTKREWVASMDDKTCPECADLDGEQAGMDEEFSPGIMDPPDPHPHCRCSVKLVTS